MSDVPFLEVKRSSLLPNSGISTIRFVIDSDIPDFSKRGIMHNAKIKLF